jgi:hypothetical protein
MKISEFLKNVEENQSEVVFYCCNHLLSKKFDIQNDEIDNESLKSLFVNYNEFTKSLNDSAGIIYRKFETDLNDVYKVVCAIFDEDFDNEFLFNYRLARVANQDATQFLEIEDEDTQETVVQKFEDKINVILESKYYNDNKNELEKELIIPQKTLELVKSATNLR